MFNWNQKGNALITVLLISLVFTTIGLAIVASSISSTKRVETRETDINITYESKKVLEEITYEMANALQSLPLDYRQIDNQYIVSDSFDTQLASMVIMPTLNKILTNQTYNESISCLSVVDLSDATKVEISSNKACSKKTYDLDSTYTIDRELDFTRVLEIILVTNNPNETEGSITRTLKKRVILSPLPSFLKYALGAYSKQNEEGLFINGSPNVNGNIYANQLQISDRAKYQLKNGTREEKSSLPPSITGNIYSSSANLIPVLKDKNFYKGEVPSLNHDSQFINIDYNRTFIQRMDTLLRTDDNLNNITIRDISETANFPSLLQNKVASIVNGQSNSAPLIENVPEQEAPSSVLGDSLKRLSNSFQIKSDNNPLDFKEKVSINGDTVINSSNYPITFDKDLVVNGDLYLVSNSQLKLANNIYVSGDLHLINFDGEMNLQGNLFVAGDLNIESAADNKSNPHNGVSINGDILTGKSIHIRPLNTTISLNSNMISLDSFTINGDEKGEESGENDIVKINSVVYTLNETFVSNINILGLPYIDKRTNAQKVGQLILLAKEKLTITRMNEFNHFHPMKETGFPYLPDEETIIQPLKAFFYTEKKAELYGVGSLFYIKGGVFAKDSLEINAIRANREFSSISDIPNSREGMLSRFIVDYDQDVLLRGIDALPIVDRLQIIPDDFVIE
ncbi:Uncharacterised protein [Niallia circulans]|uniref:hypothetical protein n=1 Tax=Niallia circulans TaxID=1397 RepID=UPI00077C2E6B|nr:hypothetical protein [Niallia circulans]MDR4317739.1 hypothetical protein [Niallia circulans]MED3841522.1 hypothetical protein [Niallia circulans]MED4243258.1 hypothetical protein [Niallia circulans]MED4250984.1 hypothetical protein [Niallia circulans]QKH62477.1 hypothetical protein FOC77_18380 [Niallia circulans]